MKEHLLKESEIKNNLRKQSNQRKYNMISKTIAKNQSIKKRKLKY